MLGRYCYVFFLMMIGGISTAYSQDDTAQKCDNKIQLSTVIKHASKGKHDGELKVEIKGGASPYQVHWMTYNFSSQGTEAKNLKPGKYTVVVIDNDKCIKRIDNIKIESK